VEIHLQSPAAMPASAIAATSGIALVRPGELRCAISYRTQRHTDEDACEEAFALFNIGDDPGFTPGGPDPRAVAYRAARYRSLAVGDVVVVNGRAYLCESVGWRRLERLPGTPWIDAWTEELLDRLNEAEAEACAGLDRLRRRLQEGQPWAQRSCGGRGGS
jgi:hypothetical protein